MRAASIATVRVAPVCFLDYHCVAAKARAKVYILRKSHSSCRSPRAMALRMARFEATRDVLWLYHELSMKLDCPSSSEDINVALRPTSKNSEELVFLKWDFFFRTGLTWLPLICLWQSWPRPSISCREARDPAFLRASPLRVV